MNRLPPLRLSGVPKSGASVGRLCLLPRRRAANGPRPPRFGYTFLFHPGGVGQVMSKCVIFGIMEVKCGTHEYPKTIMTWTPSLGGNIYIYIYIYAHPIDSVRVVRTCRGATHLFGPQTTPAARYPEPPAAPSQQRTLPSSPLHLWFLTQDLHPSEPRPRKISTPLPFDPKDGWAVHTQKRSRRKSRRQKSRG